ncbi:MAG: inositol monophosphatase family protein [Syntrophales bacterium]
MIDYRKFTIAIAREAGTVLKRMLNNKHTTSYKGEIDIVTEADRLSEDLLIGRIYERFPDHDILAEESKGTDKGSDFRWIIDPLDGTTNYAHGYPVFCVSIALEKKGEICLGVIYNPMLNEMFVAEKGKGAFLNGRRISVSGTAELSKSLLATGFPYDIRESENNNIAYFTAMAVSAQAIRRAGSAALDLAYVAAGRYDGFWELKLKPWDTAAAWLLLVEAGGVVTDIMGRDFCLSSPHILASNGKIHLDMMEVLKKTGIYHQ